VLPAGDEIGGAAIPAGVTLAPIIRRFWGLLLDQFIVALPVVFVVVSIGFTPNDNVTSKALLVFNIALTTVALVYETVMIALLGRTVGNMAFGTRVILMNGSNPGWYEAAIRALVPLSLGAIPRIGVFLSVFVYSLALWTPLRQGLHDKAAGTLVIRNFAA
jgi:uncharacterized RDD family membrane protein YckC